jgi:hypothetical protein
MRILSVSEPDERGMCEVAAEFEPGEVRVFERAWHPPIAGVPNFELTDEDRDHLEKLYREALARTR